MRLLKKDLFWTFWRQISIISFLYYVSSWGNFLVTLRKLPKSSICDLDVIAVNLAILLSFPSFFFLPCCCGDAQGHTLGYIGDHRWQWPRVTRGSAWNFYNMLARQVLTEMAEMKPPVEGNMESWAFGIILPAFQRAHVRLLKQEFSFLSSEML